MHCYSSASTYPLLLHCLLQLANKLNNAVKTQQRAPLDVYVQVNTSGEESKYGVEPQDCVSLAEHVHKECDLLKFAGLMTIGQKDYSSRPEDFEVRPCLLSLSAVTVLCNGICHAFFSTSVIMHRLPRNKVWLTMCIAGQG